MLRLFSDVHIALFCGEKVDGLVDRFRQRLDDLGRIRAGAGAAVGFPQILQLGGHLSLHIVAQPVELFAERAAETPALLLQFGTLGGEPVALPFERAAQPGRFVAR